MRHVIVLSIVLASVVGCGRYAELVIDDGIDAQVGRSHRRAAYAPRYVLVEPAYWAQPAYEPSCEASLDATGHWPTSHVFCDSDVEPYCAQALLYAGHPPTELMFCRGVDPSCAVAHLSNGGSPIALGGCRY